MPGACCTPRKAGSSMRWRHSATQKRMRAMLVGEHALMDIDLRLRISLTQLRNGRGCRRTRRTRQHPRAGADRAETRIAAAAIHIAEGTPDRAIALLSPVTERSVASLIPTWAAVHALLFDAAAREQLGDTSAAKASLERALELAEPEGRILPFTIAPVRGLLERHPRQRTAHPTLRLAILDVLDGASAPPRGEPSPLLDELSEAGAWSDTCPAISGHRRPR